MALGTRLMRFESLEQKQLLAGDVTVNVVNGVLTLEGDELANQVVVTAGVEPGSYVIHGRDGTQLIMGDVDPVTEIVVEGARHGLRANLGAGDDVLNIHDAGFRGNVAINMGVGSDRVLIGALPPVTDPAVVETELPAVDPRSVTLSQNLLINTGAGDDTVVVVNTVARGGLVVSTGEGDDIVRLGHAEEAPTDNDDTAESLASADDAVARPQVSFGRGVNVVLGEGADSLFVNSLRSGALLADGGAGADTMRINGVHSGAITVVGGRGDGVDDVAIRNAATRLLLVELGAGDDSLTLGGVKTQLALLSGGRGEGDTLTLLGENLIRHRRVVGFETINPSDPPTPSTLARRR